MKRKHTEGKWQWVGNRLRNSENKIVFTEPQFQTTASIELAEANRNLIAAAPELLEALIDIYDDLKQGAIPNDISFIEQAISNTTKQSK